VLCECLQYETNGREREREINRVKESKTQLKQVSVIVRFDDERLSVLYETQYRVSRSK